MLDRNKLRPADRQWRAVDSGIEEMDPQPTTLVGERVRLEPLTPAHVGDLFAALRVEPEVWRWWKIPPPETLAGMEAWLHATLEDQAKGNVVAFAQIDLASGKPVGSTTYLDIRRADRGLEIGSTWLGRPWQRSGINTESKYLLLGHAFEVLGAVRVQLKTDARNLQSQAAIERLGAIQEGVLRKHMYVRDGFLRDTVMYSIIAEAWVKVKVGLEAKMRQASERPSR
jgi:RimJ/RimL family protein N-acetyltransferase